ncbi:MAG: tripartite tricarboxylate transporter permease [Methanofollis sp.]|uniref:tripartite tricarboxylate transporter permease n=1 Tax=Methanofollis sp. TaxID=2052835 RepID=UPI00262EE331|nr:tripartite tricarboxylate transporter permease [Methanofollis sp.]MDD4256109.1 tripartite tricarboxylate transporter permease [Methanofollis sp.]
MIAALVAGTILGVALGTVSGLVPGVHVNTMAGLLLSLSPILVVSLGTPVLAAALVAALVTHTFLDCVPSTFLGVPDADTAVMVLPAHALCLEGRGGEAVRLSALGSAAAVVWALPFSLLFLTILPAFQPLFDLWIGVLLLAVACYLVVFSESPEWAAGVFLVSGLLGLFTFRYSFLAWNGGTGVLMPLLSGLFGVAVLISASGGRMPPQSAAVTYPGRKELFRCSCAGSLAGAVVGWLPGLSNATANAVLASAIDYGEDRRGYILATSAANTANAFLGLAALYAVGRTRNGVMVALGTLDIPPFTALLSVAALAAALAYAATVLLSGTAGIFSRVPLRPLNAAVILFVTLLSFLLCGPFGLFVLAAATLVGRVPTLVEVRRVFCMGAVMVPVILSSLGVAVL